MKENKARNQELWIKEVLFCMRQLENASSWHLGKQPDWNTVQSFGYPRGFQAKRTKVC